MLNRTGLPLSAGTAPVREYQDLLGELNNGLHGNLSVADAYELWPRCLDILRKLFLPPEMRQAELEALARVGSPSPNDVEALVQLLVTPKHLQYFLSKVSSPRWLDILLSKPGMLNPPETPQAPWPVFTAVNRLAPDYPAELAALLEKMYRGHGRKPTEAWYIAAASLDIGEPAFGVLLSALKDHPTNSSILFLGYEAPKRVDPSSELVESIADVVLNAGHGDVSPSDEWQVERLVGRLLEGMNEANADRRVLLLRHKLHPVSEDDYNRGRLELEWDRAGSIADKDDASRSDWFSILLAGLVEALDKAREWKPTVELLAHLEGLPVRLVQRLRAWILGCASDVNLDVLVTEIEQSIPARLPTGDDLALIDRLRQECDLASYSTRWCEALGHCSWSRGCGSGAEQQRCAA